MTSDPQFPAPPVAVSRTILLVEDNEQNRYLATFLLEARGHRVVPATQGQQAIDLAPALSPDLILLDLDLPVVDGYAVARALRGVESLRRVPIIAVTSYAMVGDHQKAAAAGCDGYIEKPIDPSTFAAEVERFAPER